MADLKSVAKRGNEGNEVGTLQLPPLQWQLPRDSGNIAHWKDDNGGGRRSHPPTHRKKFSALSLTLGRQPLTRLGGVLYKLSPYLYSPAVPLTIFHRELRWSSPVSKSHRSARISLLTLRPLPLPNSWVSNLDEMKMWIDNGIGHMDVSNKWQWYYWRWLLQAGV